jgi:hypothetical protein
MRAQIEFDRIRENERLETERNLEIKEFKKRQLVAAFAFLDRKNTGDAHANFHGIAEAATIYDIASNTLRDNYIIHRRNRNTILPPIPQNDPDAGLIALVNRCVIGGEKPFTVWKSNAVTLKDTYSCGITSFADIVARRKLNPNAPLRLKQGRGDYINPELVAIIRNNKSEDLKGTLHFLLSTLLIQFA